MKYLWLLLLALFFKTGPVSGQTLASRKRSELLGQLPGTARDSNRVYLLLNISNAYLKANLPDSSLIYSAEAIPLSQALSLPEAYDQGRFLACRAYIMKDYIPAAEDVVRTATGELKMQMLQDLSEHYSFRPGNLSTNLDTAWPYIRRALALTDTMSSLPATQNMRAVVGKYYYQRGDLQLGIDCFMQNIQEWQTAGNKEREAHWWSELMVYTPGTPSTVPFLLKAGLRAKELFEQAGKKNEALHSLIDVAEFHWTMGLFKLAEQEQQQVIKGLRELGQLKMYNNYNKLATTEIYLGNYNLALQLVLMAKNNMDSLQEDYMAGQIDKQLANIYWLENDIDKSLYWYRTSLRETQGRRDLIIYGTALRIVQGLVIQRNTSEALRFLTQFERDEPPVRNRDKEAIAMAWGELYTTLGQYEKAESYYLDMIRYNNLSLEDDKKEITWWYDIARTEANYTMGKFYTGRGQFARARPFLVRALKQEFLVPTPAAILRDDHLLLFRADSAAGDFASALQQRLLYEQYTDSISSEAKARQIAELQIKYESDKKDRDISLLNKQSMLQQADLSRDALVRNIILAGFLITLVIIGLLYNQYSIKQRNNKEINRKNEALQSLLGEKEWLLKEIHHRVKNNLQIVVSLLGSQSVYLSNEALEALQDTKNRVFSISLIHQKLYQHENVASIEMSAYLRELVNYLKDIYGVNQQIRFDLDIQPLELNVSQAVNLGLILNEAITNAIKYAFPEKKKGDTVTIRMTARENGIIHLTVADNGIGLGHGFDERQNNSLGLELMKGLTEDLAGFFSITSGGGTTVSIRFAANVPFERALDIMAANETTVEI